MNAILTNIGISSFIWPKAIAPFKVLLVCSPDQMEYATGIYEKLLEKGISVLFDDRDIPLAEKVEWAEQFGIYEKFILDYIDDVAFFCWHVNLSEDDIEYQTISTYFILYFLATT